MGISRGVKTMNSKFFIFSFLLFLSISLFSCSEEESSTDKGPQSEASTNKVVFYNKEFQFDSNIGSSRYLIKVSSNSESTSNSPRFTTKNLSDDSQSGFVYGLNSSDEVINLFTPFESGELEDISKRGASTIMVGSFTKDETTCLVLVSSDIESKCLVLEQPIVSSVGAAFFHDDSKIALLIDNSESGRKELYLYSSDDGFISINSGNTSELTDLEFNISGSVSDSYSSNDYAAFYVKNGNIGDIVFVRGNGDIETKVESVTSDSVHNVSGDPLFMSNGNLRQGWGRSIYYKENSNNRTISESGVLVSHKDAFFQIYYQSNYTTLNKDQDLAYINPMLFYLKPKRSNLPESYPDFTLEQINCCASLNNPSGTRDMTNKISWKKAAGFKKYALAYGEIVSSDYYEYELDESKVINISKAIILINANSKELDGDGNYQMPAISLYDYNNPSSQEDNLLNPLSYDSVSSIETYKNGFKITGTWSLNSSDQRIVFYNPDNNSIEEPTSTDQQTFVIKERL